MTLEYWYMLPVSVAVATTAMASGVGGATFFAPIMVLALRLPPEVAVGTGLITEVFGFASGVLAYARRRLIDYRLGMNLLMATVPAAVLGTMLAGSFEPRVLEVILGVGLFAVALAFLRSPDHDDVRRMDSAVREQYGGPQAERTLVARDGAEFRYTVCNKTEGRFIAGVGGFFVGLISTGLGELNGFFLLQRCRVPSAVSVATSVFVVALTALTGAVGHLVQFATAGAEVMATVGSLVVFTVPGVVVGAQVGSAVASRIPQRLLERGLGGLFALVALVTLIEVLT